MTEEDVRAAYVAADKEGSGVIVERCVPGEEHRLLVVGGRMVAATRGQTTEVVGDGVHTTQQLVDQQLNTDPRRGEEEEFPLEFIVLTKRAAHAGRTATPGAHARQRASRGPDRAHPAARQPHPRRDGPGPP